MSELIDERYVMKAGSYVADLSLVEFITWRQNDDGILLKLHIGQKEIRFLSTKEMATEVMGIWTKFRGQEIDFREYEIGGKYEFN